MGQRESDREREEDRRHAERLEQLDRDDAERAVIEERKAAERKARRIAGLGFWQRAWAVTVGILMAWLVHDLALAFFAWAAAGVQ